MALDPFLLELLVCPETRANLALASPELLARLNAAIDAGRLHDRGGRRVTEPLEQALIRQDGAVCYPVRGNLPLLVIEEQLALDRVP